tara:strand:- start:40 stop:1278 length:1239 start_codon:yes stop_codon:yes gene_type:complete
MEDISIVGGGITGLYCALRLSLEKKNRDKNIILIDERNYWGGRIRTNYRPQYEIGAARFNSTHKKLLKLIQRYKLTKLPLPLTIDYFDKNCNIFEKNTNKVLDKAFEHLVDESIKYSNSYLVNISLYEFMKKILGNDNAKGILNRFGYNSEITKMNAYDALEVFKNDFVNMKYFILKEGLSKLCDSIVAELKSRNVSLYNNHFVTNVKRDKASNSITITCKNKTFNTKKVIFCVKANQIKQFEILKPVHHLSSSVFSSPLLRIYAKYPVSKVNGPWFKFLNRTTTNGILRQIIPIDYSRGLIMISYLDGIDINAFRTPTGRMMNDTVMKNIIQKELNTMFGNIVSIPEPTYFKSHYWEVGAHHWKPGYNSTQVMQKISNPSENVYICGEAFSPKQAWIEGGLIMVDKVKHLI